MKHGPVLLEVGLRSILHCGNVMTYIYVLATITHATHHRMEVHHHPKVEKKNFKEYFLEFLMIFLAVTLGFIAENIREHIREHKNAGILAESLIEDIKKDTASLHTMISFSDQKINAVDSLLALLHKPRNQWNDTNFYRNISPVLVAFPFIPTDGTYAQMKASGTLRYFNQSLVNLMNAYDVQLKKTRLRDDGEEKASWILGPFCFDFINLEVLGDFRFNKPLTHEMYIKTMDKVAIDKFINLVVLIRTFRIRTLQEYDEQLRIADKLIEALEKQYDLENK
jgi:hypothetical protein